MRRTLQCITITATLLIAAVAQAQTVSIGTNALRWLASDVYNVNAQLHENDDDYVITNPNGTLLWKDAQGSTKLLVTGATLAGTWSDITADGEAEFNFTADSQPAKLVVRRSAGAYTIEVTLYMSESTPQIYQLTLNAYTVE